MSETRFKGQFNADDDGVIQATCDQCAKPGRCVVVDEAYICEECVAAHQRALDVAADEAWRDLPSGVQEYFGGDRKRFRRTVGIAVKAYIEFAEDDQ